ncbi:MAG TPA: sorbosone dehydrogenase family protein [Gammaproteobacteria bacterium]
MRNPTLLSKALKLWTISAASLAAGCGGSARLTVADGMGTNPELPPPDKSLIPVVDIAPAVGWTDGGAPRAADGLEVTAFARDLDHPRWLYVLPNGDVLVAETSAPERESSRKGVKALIMAKAMKTAGSAVPSADRITLLRDRDGDGRPELRTTFAENLHSPFGMALVGDDLYVANTDALMKFDYRRDATALPQQGMRVADLPAGDINYHWTKNVVASRDGARLYVTVGSNSNVGERGLEQEQRRASILEVDRATGATSVYASGLRNPNGLAWEPQTGALWAVVNERDEIGSDLVPDYLTAVEPGGFYGWPFSYYGGHVDQRVEPPNPGLVATARVPDYALGPHTASLGLVFYGADELRNYRGGAFVAQHGSWNRKPLSGYRVIYVPFSAGRPQGAARDVLTGFVNDDGEARGRPVGLAVDAMGALLVADDVGNTIWRVTAP